MTPPNVPNITVQQIRDSLLAIPAFVPVMVCPGYVTAWFTNLHDFRRRSLVERIFWSVPLSLGVSTIAAYLIGRFFSLNAVVALFAASAVAWVALLAWEWRERRRSGEEWVIGFRPLGGVAVMLALLWIAVAILSLVDWQSGNRLFMSVANFDQGSRVNWTQSILRTGIPPANPLYWYRHAAPMRNYYFWYIDCAAVARMTHIPVRAILTAGCVWSGFVLVALAGLYLKHFLACSTRMRRQFVLLTCLLIVTGLDICANFWDVFFLHQSLPGSLEWWSASQIASWLDSLLWAPHHVASLVCCMFAFLLAWLEDSEVKRRGITSVVLIAASLASAFGLSIYVAFGFFLVTLAWGFWQIRIEHVPRPTLLLGAGGAGAAMLLAPYLLELTHDSGGIKGQSPLIFAIRETFSPNGLLASTLFNGIGINHPIAARNLANLVFLAPSYVIELGFYLLVLLIYLVPAWRGRSQLNPAQRSLIFISVATLLPISVIRSSVIESNDFGWRAALLLQFPLLVLASELLTSWRRTDPKAHGAEDVTNLLPRTPQWLRSISTLAIWIGIISTSTQVLLLRFAVPLLESHLNAVHSPMAGALSHNHYFSSIGYAQLDATIPRDAVVQFNPNFANQYWEPADIVGVDHQVAIAGDKPWCGAELGGDPSGCLGMAAAIDALYKGATAEQARATCGQIGIQYLIARVYDPAWTDKRGWVWTLKPVVQDDEFRALDCR